jgi:hypothetical protein
MTSSSDPEKVQKRTPRKRAVRKRATRQSVAASTAPEVVSEKAVRPTKSRRRVPAAEPAARVSAEPTLQERKSPTPLASSRASVKQRKKQLLTVGVVLLVGIGASVTVGLTDSGQIDIQETIKARNERLRNNVPTENDVLTSTVAVPVQNKNAGKVDGGLVGLGNIAPPTPKPSVPATTTATSTEGTATSTAAVSTSTKAVTTETDSTKAVTTETEDGVESTPSVESESTENSTEEADI